MAKRPLVNYATPGDVWLAFYGSLSAIANHLKSIHNKNFTDENVDEEDRK